MANPFQVQPVPSKTGSLDDLFAIESSLSNPFGGVASTLGAVDPFSGLFGETLPSLQTSGPSGMKRSQTDGIVESHDRHPFHEWVSAPSTPKGTHDRGVSASHSTSLVWQTFAEDPFATSPPESTKALRSSRTTIAVKKYHSADTTLELRDFGYDDSKSSSHDPFGQTLSEIHVDPFDDYSVDSRESSAPTKHRKGTYTKSSRKIAAMTGESDAISRPVVQAKALSTLGSDPRGSEGTTRSDRKLTKSQKMKKTLTKTMTGLIGGSTISGSSGVSGSQGGEQKTRRRKSSGTSGVTIKAVRQKRKSNRISSSSKKKMKKKKMKTTKKTKTILVQKKRYSLSSITVTPTRSHEPSKSTSSNSASGVPAFSRGSYGGRSVGSLATQHSRSRSHLILHPLSTSRVNSLRGLPTIDDPSHPDDDDDEYIQVRVRGLDRSDMKCITTFDLQPLDPVWKLVIEVAHYKSILPSMVELRNSRGDWLNLYDTLDDLGIEEHTSVFFHQRQPVIPTGSKSPVSPLMTKSEDRSTVHHHKSGKLKRGLMVPKISKSSDSRRHSLDEESRGLFGGSALSTGSLMLSKPDTSLMKRSSAPLHSSSIPLDASGTIDDGLLSAASSSAASEMFLEITATSDLWSDVKEQELSVPTNASVFDLKFLYESQFEIPIENQHFFYRSKELSKLEDLLHSHYGIMETSKLELTVTPYDLDDYTDQLSPRTPETSIA